MGSLDLGYQSYLRATVTGALEKAARKATVGNRTREQVVDLISIEVRGVLPNNSRSVPGAIVVTPQSYYNFSSVGGGERITGDTVPLGSYNSTDCYEDRNGNGRYDATGGGGNDIGTADDIIFYTVTVQVPRLFPIAQMIGWSGNVTAVAKTLIRNQPYGAQQVIIRCS
jgi:Flp pilus assembly protein TadG